MTKEKQLELAQQHDKFVAEYNKFLALLNTMMDENVVSVTPEELQEIRSETKWIRTHITELDKVLTDFNFYFRVYKVTDEVRKEAASRPISLD